MNLGFKKRSGPRFAKAYTAVIRDPRISPFGKTLYALLKTYADESGHCFPSVATMAECLGCVAGTVKAGLRHLVEMRLIVRSPRYTHGVQTTSDYLIDDQHFAKHLARKTKEKRGSKNNPPGRVKIQPTEVEPLKKSNVVPFAASA